MRLLLNLPQLRQRAAAFSRLVGRPEPSVEIVTGSEFETALDELALQGNRFAIEWPNIPGSFWRVMNPREYKTLAASLASAEPFDDVPLIILDTGGSGVGGIRTSLREVTRHLPDLLPVLGEDLLATSDDASTCVIVHANEVEGDDGEYEVAAIGAWVDRIEWPNVGRGPTEPLESPVYG